MWWNSWAPAAHATPSSVTPPTGPCAARTAARTPTTALDKRQSAWPRPSSPSNTRGPAVSGITRMRKSGGSSFCVHQRLLFLVEPPCVCCLHFKEVWFLFFFPSFFCFQAVSVPVLDLKCIWSSSEIHSEWMCVGGWVGRLGVEGVSKRWGACAFLRKTVPLLLHSFTNHPSPHPSHASPQRNAALMFHSSLPVFSSPLLFFCTLSFPLCLVCRYIPV